MADVTLSDIDSLATAMRNTTTQLETAVGVIPSGRSPMAVRLLNTARVNLDQARPILDVATALLELDIAVGGTGDWSKATRAILCMPPSGLATALYCAVREDYAVRHGYTDGEWVGA